MPYYFRRGYYNNYRRRRWRRRNWPRRIFRRRYARRWVRKPKQKLNKITIKEWQPDCIRKCKIKGVTCLTYVNTNRLPHNSTMYESSITPDHWPGGGCFSVTQYSLESLYDMHEKCLNWWTVSNQDLPLCRYLGCKFRFYQCEYTDYIVKVTNQLPNPSNKLTYPSCQPYMMLMSDKKIVIPSKQNKKKRKPYYSVFVPPPQQTQTKWYFQYDFNKIPLIQIYTSATNLNHTYIRPQSNSNTITFYSLNTSLIQNRNMSTNTGISWPCRFQGTISVYLYYTEEPNLPTNANDLHIGNLIPLTEIKENKLGQTYNHVEHVVDSTKYKNFFKNWKANWGNPFAYNPEAEIGRYLYSFKSPETISNTIQSKTITNDLKWSDIMENQTQDYNLNYTDQPIFLPFQYNPNRDTGKDTKCYLLSNSNGTGWDPPSNDDLILEGFPMWLILWGFQDFQTKLKRVTNIDKNYMIVIKSHFTQRPTDMLLVPLGTSFRHGNSPYEQTCLLPDKLMWYPMTQYQEEEINKIVSVGPGIPSMNDCLSENITAFYTFYFKWGGCPPKNINIDNPAHQAQYPIPRNEYETNSLQNPASAPETVLYSFDSRHGSLTTTAIDRITKDWQTETFIPSITDSAKRLQLQQAFQDLQTTEEQEEQKEKEIRVIIQQLKQQQQLLRDRIISIMKAPTE